MAWARRRAWAWYLRLRIPVAFCCSVAPVSPSLCGLFSWSEMLTCRRLPGGGDSGVPCRSLRCSRKGNSGLIPVLLFGSTDSSFVRVIRCGSDAVGAVRGADMASVGWVSRQDTAELKAKCASTMLLPSSPLSPNRNCRLACHVIFPCTPYIKYIWACRLSASLPSELP